MVGRAHILGTGLLLSVALAGASFLIRPFLTLPPFGQPLVLEVPGLYLVALNASVSVLIILMGLAAMSLGGQIILRNALSESQRNPVTDLMTRRFFESEAEEFLRKERFGSKEGMILLILAVIDNVDEMLATYGQNTSEKAVGCLGRSMKDVLHEGNITGHITDHILATLIKNIDGRDVESSLARLQNRIEFCLRDHGFKRASPTCSIGGAKMIPADDFETLYKRADQCLNYARAQGPGSTFTLLSDEVVL